MMLVEEVIVVADITSGGSISFGENLTVDDPNPASNLENYFRISIATANAENA
jgi:hypothetical protein